MSGVHKCLQTDSPSRPFVALGSAAETIVIFFIDNHLNMRLISFIHIITRRRLLEFAKKHPDCSAALESWYRIVKRTDFNSFAELRQTFPSADKVGNLTVLNIGGNKARLIAAIHYNTHRVYIRHVLTHKEYDRGSWRK